MSHYNRLVTRWFNRLVAVMAILMLLAGLVGINPIWVPGGVSITILVVGFLISM